MEKTSFSEVWQVCPTTNPTPATNGGLDNLLNGLDTTSISTPAAEVPPLTAYENEGGVHLPQREPHHHNHHPDGSQPSQADCQKRVTFFSGYSKDKNFLSTLLKKNSVVQESITYYLKITTLYKFFKQSGCSRRCLIKCTLVFYCTNQSVHLYCCIILSTSTETSHDFK